MARYSSFLSRDLHLEAVKSGLCLYAVSPFSDRIYGTVTVRYGPKPYNTVKMNIRYGSGMVRETGRRTSLHGHPF